MSTIGCMCIYMCFTIIPIFCTYPYTPYYIYTQETARSKAEQHNSRFPYGFQGDPDLKKVEKEVEKRSLENLILKPYHLNQKRFGVIYSTLDALLTPVPVSTSTSSRSSSSSSSSSISSSSSASGGTEKGSAVVGGELNPTSTSSAKRSDLTTSTSTTNSLSGESVEEDISATATTATTTDTLTKRRLQQESEHTTDLISTATDAIPPSLYTSHIHTTTVKDITSSTSTTTTFTGGSRKATDAIRGDGGTTSTTTSSATLPTTPLTPTNGVSTSGGSEYDDKQQRKRDPRKKISLAAMYNLNGTIGNTAIWNTAVDYLYTHKILNFKVLLPLYLTKERESCVYMKSLLYPPTSPPQSSSSSSATSSGPEWSIFRAWAKIWSRFWVWPAVLFQNLKDPECGIIYCDADTM